MKWVLPTLPLPILNKWSCQTFTVHPVLVITVFGRPIQHWHSIPMSISKRWSFAFPVLELFPLFTFPFAMNKKENTKFQSKTKNARTHAHTHLHDIAHKIKTSSNNIIQIYKCAVQHSTNETHTRPAALAAGRVCSYYTD